MGPLGYRRLQQEVARHAGAQQLLGVFGAAERRGQVTRRTRDPLTPVRRESAAEGAAARQVSAGGLVSALMGVSNFKTCWVGWPGAAPRHGRS
jgi:hypothetical protein